MHVVDATEFADGSSDQGADRIIVGDVERDADRAPAGVAHFRRHGLCGVAVEVAHDDGGALGAEAARGRRADAGSAAGDHHDLVRQPSHALLPS
jgi:hypothetical protein